MTTATTKIDRALGHMSGTSVDGSVSAAIIETDGADFVKRLAVSEYCYEDESGLRPIHHFTKAAEVAYRIAKGEDTLATKAYSGALRDYVRTTFSVQNAEVDEKLAELSAAAAQAMSIGRMRIYAMSPCRTSLCKTSFSDRPTCISKRPGRLCSIRT